MSDMETLTTKEREGLNSFKSRVWAAGGRRSPTILFGQCPKQKNTRLPCIPEMVA